MENATLTFHINAGALVRGQIKGFIKGVCMQNNVACEVEEAKGLLQSTYFFKLTGEKDKVLKVESIINEFNELNKDDA